MWFQYLRLGNTGNLTKALGSIILSYTRSTVSTCHLRQPSVWISFGDLRRWCLCQPPALNLLTSGRLHCFYHVSTNLAQGEDRGSLQVCVYHQLPEQQTVCKTLHYRLRGYGPRVNDGNHRLPSWTSYISTPLRQRKWLTTTLGRRHTPLGWTTKVWTLQSCRSTNIWVSVSTKTALNTTLHSPVQAWPVPAKESEVLQSLQHTVKNLFLTLWRCLSVLCRCLLGRVMYEEGQCVQAGEDSQHGPWLSSGPHTGSGKRRILAKLKSIMDNSFHYNDNDCIEQLLQQQAAVSAV